MLRLIKLPQLWVVCGMAFALYIMRETFNDWTVDFFKTEGGAAMSNQVAALLSTPFDAAGAVGIVLLGWMFDRLTGRRRTVVLFGTLALLALLIFGLPSFYRFGLWQVETVIGLIGFLSYGPYSLLAGVLAAEIGGRSGVGTVAGLVDSSGYRGHGFRRAFIWPAAGSRRLPAGISRFGVCHAGGGLSLPRLEIGPPPGTTPMHLHH